MCLSYGVKKQEKDIKESINKLTHALILALPNFSELDDFSQL